MQPRRLRYKKSMPAPAPANVTISVALCLGVKYEEVDNNLTPSHHNPCVVGITPRPAAVSGPCAGRPRG